MLATSLHLLVGLLGLSLLYAALFLHENEEGQLQNRLEKLWVAVDDLSKAALSKQTAFLQQVSAMANSALNRLFGERLFSLEAVSTSICFSVGSALLFLAYLRQRTHSYDEETTLIVVALGVVSFVVGWVPIPFRYLGLLWIPGSTGFLLYVDWHRLPKLSLKSSTLEGFLPLFAIFVGGFLSDVVFIVLSRWCLRKSSVMKDGLKIAFLITLNGAAGLVLISPAISEIALKTERYYYLFNKYLSLSLVGASNLVTGAIALLFVVLALAALVHLAVWPILERPIYSLQRFGIARQPKFLAAASVTCLLFAWPNSPIIHGIIKLIHGG
jgi:hypothetical protein